MPDTSHHSNSTDNPRHWVNRSQNQPNFTYYISKSVGDTCEIHNLFFFSESQEDGF